MALNLTGPAGLFTRLGHMIYGVNSIVNQYRGTDLPGQVDIIQQDYSDSDQNLVEGIYTQLSNSQVSHTAIINYWRNLAQNTVTQMVNNHEAQLKQDYQTALLYLFNFMIDNNETLTRNTISATVAENVANLGDGVILAGTYNNFGFPLEQMFNEDVRVHIVRDVQGGASVGQESIQFTGTYGTTDMLHWLWPKGSNGFVSTTAITPSVSKSTNTKNWLTNGMMETFTTNVPSGWHVSIGTPGTTIFQDVVTFYDGASSLKILGDGTELTELITQFGVDFPGKAIAVDQLAVNLWYKLSAIPTTGTLVVSLVDDTGLVIDDAAGNPSSFDVDLTAGDTSWHSLGGFLRMPSVLPSGVHLSIGLGEALETGVSLNIDRIAMARPVVFYPGGPSLACFSGNIPWKVGDLHTLSTHNAFDGLMQSGCNQLLNLSNYGLIFPSTTGTATIPDSLVS